MKGAIILPRDHDNDSATVAELLDGMNQLMAAGYTVFVKWTCPKCGVRVTSGDPNVYHSAGYYHDSPGCGALYTGTHFGIAAVLATDKEALAKLLAVAYEAEPSYEGDLPGLREKGG